LPIEFRRGRGVSSDAGNEIGPACKRIAWPFFAFAADKTTAAARHFMSDIDKGRAVGLLNRILESELAGVIR
jgi:hypothetical protein